MIRELDRNEYYKIIELGKKLNPKFNEEFIGALEQVFIYEQNNEIIGFVECLKLYEVLEIINIIVKEDKRNLGVGTKLLNSVIDENVQEVILEVKDSNKDALDFYKKNGFNVIRTINGYYRDGSAYVMERKI